MVEFDMPGHAGSWCSGYPEVCPSSKCTQPLNVASNATFELIAGLLGECTGGAASMPTKPSGLFPYNLIHLGGDEVNTGGTDEALASSIAHPFTRSPVQSFHRSRCYVCVVVLSPTLSPTLSHLHSFTYTLSPTLSHLHSLASTLSPALTPAGCWTSTPSVAAWLQQRNMTADQGTVQSIHTL
jgi:hypothetical protein